MRPILCLERDLSQTGSHICGSRSKNCIAIKLCVLIDWLRIITAHRERRCGWRDWRLDAGPPVPKRDAPIGRVAAIRQRGRVVACGRLRVADRRRHATNIV